MPQVDLNRLREVVLQNQRQGEVVPADRSKQVLVDRDGGIRTGDQVSGEDTRPLSEVHQGTFAVLDLDNSGWGLT